MVEMDDMEEYKFYSVALRNGFGIDMDIVDDQPVWTWKKDEVPGEDPANVGVFTGTVIHLPFVKIMIGSVFV